MKLIINRITIAIAAMTLIASLFTIVAQFAVVPHEEASAKALSKECKAYSAGKRGWGCSRIDPLLLNPLPTLLALVASALAITAISILQSTLITFSATIYYGTIFLACAISRGINHFLNELSIITYLFGAAISLTMGIFLLWLAGTPARNRARSDKQRKKSAGILMEQEIAIRHGTNKRP